MKWILIISLFYVPAVYCQSFWQVKNHNASVTTQFTGKAFKYAVLNINWDETIGCRPTIGLVLTKTKKLGTFKSIKESSEPMVVSVGNDKWSGKTFIASYTGGTEALFVAPTDLINAMDGEGVIHVRVFQKSAVFEFPLVGAGNAAAKAKINCK